ncbi:hypothetical protein [Saccharothrix lopnurensis]|uniref:tRNA-guanine family transglycosylase n=1 Tax=Saccharothrix lopnurensis TaxID=1670621 RepID=A0ABW1P869_9PSEU
MTNMSPANLPAPRPPTDETQARAAALHALGLRPAPAAPPGPIGELTDRVLVHTNLDTDRGTLMPLLADVDGLVLSGKKACKAVRELRRSRYQGLLLADPEGYASAAATAEEPFVLPSGGLFGASLSDVLQGQRDAGVTAVMTPTAYFRAGEIGPLKAAAKIVAALDSDDVLFSVPIDVAWLSNDHIDSLIAVLKRLALPKVVLLGGQFDPLKRYKSAVANLRRLVAEAGHVAVFRTDLTAFDVLSHGAFAASIGTGGSRRHVVPFGQFARSSGKEPDYSPSVLHPELMSFHKGSLLAERFGNTRPPQTCPCPACAGQGLDRFTDKSDRDAAHAHGIRIWTPWIAEMHRYRVLAERAEWWKRRCADAVAHCGIVNALIEQEGAFNAPNTLKAWSELPAWWAPASSDSRSRTP